MADIEAVKNQAKADIEHIKLRARDALNKLNGELQASRAEAEAYKAELENARRGAQNAGQNDHKLEEYEQRCQQLESQILQLNQVVANQQTRLDNDQDELGQMKSRLAKAQEEIVRLQENESKTNIGGSSNEEASALKAKLEQTEEKLNKTRENAKKHILQLQHDCEMMEKEKVNALQLAERLQSQLNVLQQQQSQATGTSTSSGEPSSSSSSLSSSSAPTQILQQQDGLIARFESAESNLQRASQLLEESEREKKQFQQHSQKMEADLEKVKEAAKRKVEELMRELEKKNQGEEKIRKQAEEENRKTIDTYEAQIKTLKDAISTASSAVASNSRSPAPSDALVRMNRENKEIQSKLDSAVKELQQVKADSIQAAKVSREAIERNGKERADLKRELDYAKDEAIQAQKELAALKQQMQTQREELEKLRQSTKQAETKSKNNSEMTVYTEKIMKLEQELRREQTKSEELSRTVQSFDAEVARLAGVHLEKYNTLDIELVEKRETLALLEEQNQELKRTNILMEQRMEELRRKSRDQFQTLLDQLEQAKHRMEEATKAEQTARQELAALATLKRQNTAGSSTAQQPSAVQTPPPQPIPSPTSTPRSSDFRQLEEEKLRAESKRREAMDDLTKAKKDYSSAKREAIQLAESVDRLRSGLNKAALQAGGNLALAADRCDDALRQCVIQIDAAVAAIQARELTKSSAPSQSGGLKDGDRLTRHRQSSMEDPGSPLQSSSMGKKEQEPEERLVNALNEAEKRLDDMTSSLRQLLPKVKQVVTIAVQDKKSVNAIASICNLSAIIAKLFQKNQTQNPESGYQGLQLQGTANERGGGRTPGGFGRSIMSRRRVEPETPGTESGFELEEESVN